MAALKSDTKIQKSEKPHLEYRIIVSNLRSTVTAGDIEVSTNKVICSLTIFMLFICVGFCTGINTKPERYLNDLYRYSITSHLLVVLMLSMCSFVHLLCWTVQS